MGTGGGSRKKRYTRDVPHSGYTSSSTTGGSGIFDDCDSISFKTTVTKPTALIAKVKVGEVLSINLSRTAVLEVLNENEDLCGTIVGPQSAKIIECIKKGRQFQAVVETISSMSCHVKVETHK